jgi:hypothetical protein
MADSQTIEQPTTTRPGSTLKHLWSRHNGITQPLGSPALCGFTHPDRPHRNLHRAIHPDLCVVCIEIWRTKGF